ncbi:MAG: hypothetical protein OQK82_03125, partial [Candidatus Pacearchaeota archaeon]|nr:hypothetical protein [Candidatus Pacearchaeota archaeon]
MHNNSVPVFPGAVRKNDAVFLYGALQKKPYVKIYEQYATEVVYGPSCRCEKEVDVKRCNADGVPLVERRGGGGTVVLSQGMVVCIIVGERTTGLTAVDCFNRIHHQIVALLEPFC